MYRNTSRGDEPFQFVLTGFDYRCQDTIVIKVPLSLACEGLTVTVGM
jgi:hypothetical protein